MCDLVPCDDELVDLGLAHRLRRQVSDAKPFPWEHRKPLLDLMHPRALARGAREDKARMALQPLAHCLARMRRDMSTDDLERCDGLGKRCLPRCEQGPTRSLPLAAVTLPVALACPRSAGGKPMQRTIASILLFDTVGEPRRRGLRGREPRPWLQGGCFIEAEAPCIGLEGAGREGDEGGHLRREGRSAGICRR